MTCIGANGPDGKCDECREARWPAEPPQRDEPSEHTCDQWCNNCRQPGEL